jgi:hypothetical protein
VTVTSASIWYHLNDLGPRRPRDGDWSKFAQVIEKILELVGVVEGHDTQPGRLYGGCAAGLHAQLATAGREHLVRVDVRLVHPLQADLGPGKIVRQGHFATSSEIGQ